MKDDELPISDEEPKECSSCGRILSRHHWNTRVDILYCENPKCELKHSPQGNIQINYQLHSMDWLNQDEQGLTIRRRRRSLVPA